MQPTIGGQTRGLKCEIDQYRAHQPAPPDRTALPASEVPARRSRTKRWKPIVPDPAASVRRNIANRSARHVHIMSTRWPLRRRHRASQYALRSNQYHHASLAASAPSGGRPYGRLFRRVELCTVAASCSLPSSLFCFVCYYFFSYVFLFVAFYVFCVLFLFFSLRVARLGSTALCFLLSYALFPDDILPFDMLYGVLVSYLGFFLYCVV